jgi:hypothetical protein
LVVVVVVLVVVVAEVKLSEVEGTVGWKWMDPKSGVSRHAEI